MKCFHFSWMRKQKMRTQIIILNLFLLFITIILIEIAFYIQKLIFNQISLDTVKILSQQDASSIIRGAVFLSIHIQNRQESGNSFYYTVIRQIQSVKNFFDFYQQNQFLIANQFIQEPCIRSTEIQSFPIITKIPRFCYQANGIQDSITLPQDDETVQFIQSAVSLLNAFSLVQDSMTSNVLQIASLSDTQFFSQFPFGFIYKTYDIRQRPWYQYHLKQSKLFPNQSLFISSLYQYFNTTQLEVAATQSIFKNGKAIGIVKQSIKIQSNLIPKVPYNILLIDQRDNVIYQNNQSLANLSKYFVYQQNETGLNESDWESIKAFSHKHSDEDYIQLIDKRFDTVINVHSEEFYPENFTFVVTSNVTKLIELQEQFDGINNKMMLEFLQILMIQILAFAFIIIIEIIVITKIFQPMAQLQSIVKNHVNSVGNNVDINMFKIAFCKQHFHCETSLHNQFINLQDILNRSQYCKSEVCQQQETIELNRKERNLNTQFIRKGLRYISNNRKYVTRKCLEIINQYYRQSSRSISH